MCILIIEVHIVRYGNISNQEYCDNVNPYTYWDN